MKTLKWSFVGLVLIMGIVSFLYSCKKNTNPATAGDDAHGERLQGDFFISPEGNDANDGRSPSSPLRTLKRAFELVQGGETIVLLHGTYDESIDLTDFSPGDTVIIQGESAQTGRDEDRPVLDGGRQKNYFIFCWQNCSNITIEHLTIRNYVWTGLLFYKSSNIQLRHLHVSRTGFVYVPDLEDWGDGIRFDECSQCLLENSTIENTGGISSDNELHGHGVVVYGSTNTTIRDNVISDIKGDGMVVEDSCHIIVERNEIRNVDVQRATWYGGAIDTDGGLDVIIRNNVFRNSNGPGINIGDEEIQYPSRSKGWKVTGNTFDGHKFGVYIWNFGMCPPSADIVQMEGNTFMNNVQDVYCAEWLCHRDDPCYEQPTSPAPC